MTHLLLAVMGQAKYVCAVHRLIQDLLLKTAPELLKGSAALKTDKEFKDTIDTAIASVTTPNAKERDYIRVIVETARTEMKPLCHLLRGAAEVVGLGKVADQYLDGARFREMLLRKDEERLERLNGIVQGQGQAVPVKILMDVAAELDGRAENYDGMDAAAKRKAARDMTKLIGKVEEMRSAIEHRIDEGKDEIVSHVDAVGKKVEKLKPRGKRKSKYGEAMREVCDKCWKTAQHNAEARHSVNTRVTYEAVFEHSRRELSEVGVRTIKDFRKILHAVQSRECDARKRELEAKAEAARKARPSTLNAKPALRNTPPRKSGIIRDMKK